MPSKLIEIPITKATLFLYEEDLLAFLPIGIIRDGIKRGKGIKRSRAAAARVKPEETKLEGVSEEWLR